jgi:hypothetical protein
VPHQDQSPSAKQLAADRRRVIEQRLQDRFYEVPPASERIAAGVLAELTNFEQGTSALSF